MTLLTSANRINHLGDGVTGTFTFAFPILVEPDLKVFVAGVLKTLGVHYTLIGEADPGGGPQIFPDGGKVAFTGGNIPADDAEVLLIRIVPITQPAEYPVGNKFPSQSHEKALDRGAMIAQQLNEADQRTLKLAPQDVLTGQDYTLPSSTPASRAGKVIGFDAEGDSLMLVENTIAGAQASANAAAASAAAAAASAVAADASADAAAASAAQMPPVPGAGDALKLLRVKADETGYEKATVAGLGDWQTGDMKATARATEPAGWLFCSGLTIGSATSGATARANADAAPLFTVLWDAWNNTVLPIQDSAGAPTTRGANAAADFAANKRLPLPDLRGRGISGKDDMGGAAASRLTGAGSGIVGTTLGAFGGVETYALTEPELRHKHFFTTGTPSQNVGRDPDLPATAGPDHVHTGTTDNPNNLATTAHQNTQPTLVCNWLIKYS